MGVQRASKRGPPLLRNGVCRNQTMSPGPAQTTVPGGAKTRDRVAFVRLLSGRQQSREGKLIVTSRTRCGSYTTGGTMTAGTWALTTGDLSKSSRDPDSRIQQTAKIHQVALILASEFTPVVPLDMVSSVVTRACRDLASEVPAESLPEFVHHAARQRLIDACGVDPLCTEIRRTRRRAS